MLDNKKLNMIISLIIAIALWAFVIGEINPQATRVYRDVPIKLVQQEILDESGLAVILKNNKPRYVVVDFDEYDTIAAAMQMRKSKIESTAERLLEENLEALLELGK